MEDCLNYQRVNVPNTALTNPGKGRLFVEVDTSSVGWVAAGVVTLPATPSTGCQIFVKDSGGLAGVSSITVSAGASTIDGASQVVLSNPFEAILVAYSGTAWVRL